MTQVVIVGLGGFLGAISRYGIGVFVRSFFTHPFPVATFLINFAGCFCIGLFFESCKNHPAFPNLQLFLVVGFLGAFTTFSAFGFETIELIKRANHLIAALYVLASLGFCLLGVLGGEWLGKRLAS